MKDEDWKCCKCSKTKAAKHEELWSFGTYGNNQLTVDDSRLGNQYCEDHFKQKEEELNKKAK